MLKSTVLLLSIWLVSISALAALNDDSYCDSVLTQKPQSRVKSGYVFQRDDLPIYYDFYRVRNPKSVIVISNGLVYELGRYEELVKELNKAGYSVLVYAHRAQHQSEEHARALGRVLESFTHQDLTNDLEDLIEALQISRPIDLVSISYGTAVAAEYASRHPGGVRTLNLLAPLVRVATPYVLARTMATTMRSFNPFLSFMLPNPSTPYELMVTAIHDFDLAKYNFRIPTAMFVAGEESEKLRPSQSEYWTNHLSLQGGRRFEIRNATHVMPSSAPRELAKALVNFIGSVKK